MNYKTSDKWDVVKWCGKIIKLAFGVAKWHNFCTSCYGCSKIGFTTRVEKHVLEPLVINSIPIRCNSAKISFWVVSMEANCPEVGFITKMMIIIGITVEVPMSQSGWETQEKRFWEHFVPLVETPFIESIHTKEKDVHLSAILKSYI